MRPKQLLLPLTVCAALAAGCGGGDDDPEPAAAPTGPNAAYISEISSLCADARNQQALLDEPSPGKNDELSAYLKKVLAIQADFRQRAKRLKPPASLRADQKRALDIEQQIADTIASYERAARGGNRRFLKIVRALQDEANPQIEKINEVFDRMEVEDCKLEELNRLSG